jgi:glycosyltransferase involved in cell wall biosynthesis
VNGGERHRGLQVVMLLLNPYTNDTRVEKEAASLRDAGYRVTILALADENLPRIEVRGGIVVHRIPRPTWPPLLRFFSHRRRMLTALQGLGPDIIHADDTETLDVAAIAASRLHVPFVYDAHELWLERVRRDRSRVYWSLARAYFARIERRYLRRAAACITVSAPIARHLEAAYGLDEVAVVPNYPQDEPAPAERELRSLPGADEIPRDAPIVLYLGNATAGRGIEYLIAAMARVPHGHLVLLGAAEQGATVQRRALQYGVSDRVHALPRVAPDEVVAYAASATIGVSPIPPTSLSYRYSLPNKLFQYMQAGLPVVASDFPQVREIVEETGAGTTVDPVDVRALATAIERYLADPALRREAGERGQRAVRERFNWSVSAAVLREVYARVAEGRGTG